VIFRWLVQCRTRAQLGRTGDVSAMPPNEVRHEIGSRSDDGGCGRGRAGGQFGCGPRTGVGADGRGERCDLCSISAARIRTCTPTVSVPIIGRYLPIKRARASIIPKPGSGLLWRPKYPGGVLIAVYGSVEARHQAGPRKRSEGRLIVLRPDRDRVRRRERPPICRIRPMPGGRRRNSGARPKSAR
jgi:hypothetical protein